MSGSSRTPDVGAFRERARSFFARAVTPEVRRELRDRRDEHVPSFFSRMANEGWISMPWPERYGGGGASAVENAIFQEEAAFAGAPTLAANLNSIIGNTLITVGSESLKRSFVGGLAAGEHLFCLGYTEPEAGSDLAALRTRAVLDGDEYLVNGAKIFTSLAHVATHVFLAARTEANGERHAGLSVLIVDMDSPGITIDPVWTLGGFRTNMTFYDNVRVPADRIVMGPGQGWKVLKVALDFERSGTLRVGEAARLLELIRSEVGKRESSPPGSVEARRYGALATRTRAARALCYKVARMQASGIVPHMEASMAKVVGTELVQSIADAGLDLLGQSALASAGSPWAPADGELEAEYRNTVRFSVTAGTNEIQRNIIAERGLGLPRD
ncbi:MAG: acyl-CoA dehydrogenase family protein [Actinomycetota bacterium]